MLLEHPGELVTREQLSPKKLWPSDTFVDFDVGLILRFKRLRERWATRPKAALH